MVLTLHLLCQHHHNDKTQRKIQVAMGADGVEVWTYPDGTSAVTMPEGPWAEKAVHGITVEKLQQARPRNHRSDGGR